MLITIAAIGKIKAGPERALFERYIERTTGAGRSLALTLATREFVESRYAAVTARKDQEAEALLGAAPAGHVLIALDESGKSLDSRAFADKIAKWRDNGTPGLVFAIGGADGHGPALIQKSTFRLAFGPMTWPHQLARIMLAEQIYRAVTILSGHPYHRD